MKNVDFSWSVSAGTTKNVMLPTVVGYRAICTNVTFTSTVGGIWTVTPVLEGGAGAFVRFDFISGTTGPTSGTVHAYYAKI